MSDSHQEHGHDHGHAPCAQGQCGHAPATEAAHAHDEHGHGAASAHGHDDHGHGHDAHGHDDHGHGHGGHSPWIDYNAKAPEPSKLPPVGSVVLAVLGLALAGILASIVTASLTLAAQPHEHEEPAHESGAAPEHHQPGKEH